MDIIIEALKNLRREGVRTFLTLIGVIIGIAAIFSLLTIGNGVTLTFEEQFESIGTNTVFVAPGDAFSTNNTTTIELTESDTDFLRNLSGVKSVIEEFASPAAMEFNNEKKNVVLFAIDEEGFDFFTTSDFFDLVEGRWVRPGESGSIMINKGMAEDTFGREVNIRKQVNINGETYKVVGIFEMNAVMSGFAGGGGMAFTTIEGYERIFSAGSPVEIMIKTINTEVVPNIKEEIEEYFEDKYGKKSMTVLTLDQSIEQFNSILGLLTIFIVGIAGISLVVGGVGIMNAMVTSVLERTKEIGLYKAIGASNRKILSLFLLEAAFIGLIGGIIGSIFGYIIAGIIAAIANETGIPILITFSPELLIGMLIFSMLVGMLSGFYPALKASKKDPVEALRSE